MAGAKQVDGIALYPAFAGVQFLGVRTLTSRADRAQVPWILESALGERQGR